MLVLTVDGVAKSFSSKKMSSKRVLQGINFSLSKGEIVGLIGESGSGKTTLARIIADLETADSGNIIWLEKEKKRPFLVQMVFQNPYAALYKKMRVKEIIAEPLLLQNKKIKPDELASAVNEVLDIVSLGQEYGERYPGQLSGGQRQRVALARALILKPSLLIADEPTSMLDMAVQADILNLLARLRQEWQMTILLVTHDLLSAEYLCDRILVIHQGILVEQGKTISVLNNPQHECTKKLVKIAEKNKNILFELKHSFENEINNHEG